MTPMKKHRTYHRGWKSQSKETLIYIWVVCAALALSLFVTLSMGSREIGDPSSVRTQFNTLRSKLRGWEKPAIAVSQDPTQTSDARTHTAYHFRWHSKFSSPEWTLENQKTDSRQDLIQQTLRIGKSKLNLTQRKDNPNLYTLREFITKGKEVFVEKKILPLLPGERVLVSMPAGSLAGRIWKMRVRSIGATQDRLDVPLSLNSGFINNETKIFEVDPRGRPTDLELPTSAEFLRRGVKQFFIEWPSTASGILAVEGFSPALTDGELRQTPSRTLVVQIDSLHQPLTALTKTLNVLKNYSSSGNPAIHFTTVVPPSQEHQLSQKSMLTLRNPVELGATLGNEKLKSFIQPEPILLKKYSERGGSLRRLHLIASSQQCPSPCNSTDASILWPDEYTSLMTIHRKEEFATLADFFRNDEFQSDFGILFADIRFPADSVRLNWTSALEPTQPLLRWMIGGLRDMTGSRDLELRKREKLFQTDLWLAKLSEAFLSHGGNANIALFLNNNTSSSADVHDETGQNIVRGEALFSLHGLNVGEDKNSFPIPVKNNISLLTAVKLMDKMIHSKERTLSLESLADGGDIEHAPVTQLNQGALITLSPNGWITDLIPGVDDKKHRTAFRADPEQIHAIQEKSNADRRRSRLHGLHVLLPSNNDKDELVSVTLSTNLKPVGCESESENAQLEPQKSEPSVANAEELRTVRILGRRSALSQWHIHCLLEGRITTSTRLRMVMHLNNQPVLREKIGLGEFSLPVRGFLWRSPETLELTGAQILDATVAIKSADKDAAKQTSVVIWTDSVLGGLENSRMVFSLAAQAQPQSSEPVAPSGGERLSGK